MLHDRSMLRSWGRGDGLVAIYYAAFCLLVAAVAIIRPFPNWDAICYAASARSIVVRDPSVLRREVYSDLARSVPPATYRHLTTGTYRQTVSENDDAFIQQLPLYKIRCLYNAAVFVTSSLGVGATRATHVVSALSVAVAMWTLLVAFRRRLARAPLFLIPVASIPLGLLATARYGTPDGMALLMISLTVFLMLDGRQLLFVILPLSVLVRTDLIIFTVLIASYFVVVEKRWRTAAVASVIASAVTYVLVNRFFNNYGLGVTYYMTFIETLPYPATTPVEFGWGEYLAALREGMGEASTNRAFLLFIGSFIASLILLWRRRGIIDWRAKVPAQMGFVMAAAFVYVFAHFFAFPEIEARFFVGPYLLYSIGFLWLVAPRQSG